MGCNNSYLTLVNAIANIGKNKTKNGRKVNLIQTDRHQQQINLGAMLEGYGCPAILVSAKYEILAYNSAYRDAFGELALDQKPNCYAVSHGYQVPCDQAG